MQISLFSDDDPEGLDRPASRVFSVSEITYRIKVLLESDLTLQDLRLEGEISNWRPYPSGHIYFTLKDEGASIRCVIWRSTVHDLTYLPSSDGEAVVARGHVSVYENQGQYQFYVEDILPAGTGALYQQFERLKARLAEEGLFERAQRPLPEFPRRIGIVTSPAGAALRDILNVLRRRFPLAEVILSPSLVQGADAPPQIVTALRRLARVPGVDVIILARGGGSLEDLWAFNDERVARAVAASPIPIICGVGHETDFTIADFAADVRAPTPSAAAELAVPDKVELEHHLAQQRRRLAAAMFETITSRRNQLAGEERALQRSSPRQRIDQQRQRLDERNYAARRILSQRLRLHREQVNGMGLRLRALNPAATLARGYAIVRREENGRVVVSVKQVTAGDHLSIQVSDGTFPGTAGGNT